MAFSDARNERDRAETGRNSTNHGGGDHAGAARRNTNAMAARNSVTMPGPGTRPTFQPRRTQNVTPSYELTPHNIQQALGMAPLGPMSAVGSLLGALGVPGFAPEFEGFTGNVMGPGDYDPRNRIPAMQGQGLMSRMNRRAGRPGQGLQYKGY
jgi:hypothetical protein